MRRPERLWKAWGSRCPTEIRSTFPSVEEQHRLGGMIVEIELRKEDCNADWHDWIGPYGSKYGSTSDEGWPRMRGLRYKRRRGGEPGGARCSGRAFAGRLCCAVVETAPDLAHAAGRHPGPGIDGARPSSGSGRYRHRRRELFLSRRYSTRC